MYRNNVIIDQLNTIYPCIPNLDKFLENEKFKRSSGDKDIRFINVKKKKVYNIPDEYLSTFFELLNNCYKNDITMHFLEKQQEYSGYVWDFDIQQEHNISQITSIHIYKLVHELCKIMFKYIDIHKFKYNEEIEIYFVCIKKKNLELNSNQIYKDGFHLICPSIKLSRSFKKFIHSEIINKGIINDIFSDTTIKNIDNMLDKGTCSNPIHFIGSCKIGSNPYYIDKIFNITFNPQTNPVFDIIEYKEDFLKDTNTNIIYELSINYELSKIKKTVMIHDKKYDEQVKKFDVSNDNNIENNLTTDLDDDISILAIHNPDAAYIKQLLDILNVDRAREYLKWRDVIFALAKISTNQDFKNLAEWFSRKALDKFSIQGFNKTWRSGVSYVKEKRPLVGIGMIQHYANSDNSEKYKIINTRSAKETLGNILFHSLTRGRIQDSGWSRVLQIMIGAKFVADDDDRIRKGPRMWYEFILPNDAHEKGEIFKWREHLNPDNIKLYISDKLPILCQTMVNFIDIQIRKATDKNLEEFYLTVKKNFDREQIKLRSTLKQGSIIKACEPRFKICGFTKSLNTDPLILGVGNGVLELSSNPKLIKGYHSHRITYFTSVNYIKYNAKKPYIIKIEKILKDLFPEQDARTFIMCYLANCLDGTEKSSMFLIIKGTGANGKSTLMELMINTLGDQYTKKMDAQFLVEKKNNSNNASPMVMQLKNTRFVYYSETHKGDELNESQLKEITGQETLVGRNLHKGLENFRPHCHHICTTNYDLIIRSTDHGIWRRIKYYKMNVKFCENPEGPYERKIDQSISKLKDSELAKEAFLSILVQYYIKLNTEYRGNLNNIAHPTIKKHTEEYRNDQDTINKFIEEHIVCAPEKHKIKQYMGDLISIYKKWHDRNESSSAASKMNTSYIKQSFENSSIGKYFEKTNRSKQILKNMRALMIGGEKEEYEIFYTVKLRQEEEAKLKKEADNNLGNFCDNLDNPCDDSDDEYSDKDDLDEISNEASSEISDKEYELDEKYKSDKVSDNSTTISQINSDIVADNGAYVFPTNSDDTVILSGENTSTEENISVEENISSKENVGVEENDNESVNVSVEENDNESVNVSVEENDSSSNEEKIKNPKKKNKKNEKNKKNKNKKKNEKNKKKNKKNKKNKKKNKKESYEESKSDNDFDSDNE